MPRMTAVTYEKFHTENSLDMKKVIQIIVGIFLIFSIFQSFNLYGDFNKER